jgi:hypothetical protein
MTFSVQLTVAQLSAMIVSLQSGADFSWRTPGYFVI